MKGFIYKIYDNTNGNCYYGSTKSPLNKRLHSHKSAYKNFCNGGSCKYCYSYKIIENGDYDISLVEEVEYENKQELHARERFYIENNECVNKILPNRDMKEYYITNKEKYLEYNRQNKEARKVYNKRYKEKKKLERQE